MNAAVEEAMKRHPSAQPAALEEAVTAPGADILTAADRCDQGCGAGALYRVILAYTPLDFCHHHFHRFFPDMVDQGWKVSGANPELYSELYQSNRLKGGDHA